MRRAPSSFTVAVTDATIIENEAGDLVSIDALEPDDRVTIKLAKPVDINEKNKQMEAEQIVLLEKSD